MRIGDLEKTSKGRYFLNTWMIPKCTTLLKNGQEVLFIGTDTEWDYKPFFWNPSKQCPYTTIDKNSTYNPDIVGNIENMPQIESGKYSLVIMIGIYEFLDKISEAFTECLRVLKPGGYLLVAFPGKGYYNDDRGISPNQVGEILKDYRVLETHYLYEGSKEPNSICVLCQKLS